MDSQSGFAQNKRSSKMNILPTPWSVEAVTAGWLNYALSRFDKFKKYHIEDISYEMISQGKGFSGEVWRLSLSYADKDNQNSPKNIVAKFASRVPATRKLVKSYALNEVEVYRNIATASGKIFPEFYFADSDYDYGDICILMEDLSCEYPANNIEGLSLADAITATESIAAFHALWWNVKGLNWLRPRRAHSDFLRKLFVSSGISFLEIYGDLISRDFRLLVEEYPAKIPTIMSDFSQPPITVGHGDFRPDNFFFRNTDSDHSNTIAIDWQLTTITKGIRDISYMTAWGIPVESQSDWEGEILESYLRLLSNGNVSNYSKQELEHDYRLGFFSAFQVLVIASTNLENETQRGEDLVKVVNDRMDSIIQNYDLLALLRKL